MKVFILCQHDIEGRDCDECGPSFLKEEVVRLEAQVAEARRLAVYWRDKPWRGPTARDKPFPWEGSGPPERPE